MDTNDATQRREWGIEIAVVVAVAVLPDLARAVSAFVRYGPTIAGIATSPASSLALHLIPRSISVLAVLAFVVWRSREPLATFGIAKPSLRDLFDGVLVWVVQLTVLCGASWVSRQIYESTGGVRYSVYDSVMPTPVGEVSYLGLAWISIVNGLGEQCALSGFLLPRLRALFRAWPPAIACVAAVFGSYHIYQGFGSAALIGFLGLISGLYFQWRRRLLPLVIAHALGDFVGLTGILRLTGLVD